jgi:hypothetical protein
MSADLNIPFAQLLASAGLGGTVAGAVIFMFVKSYFPSYLSKKAENLATKEDIAEITKRVEAVRSSYAVSLENLKAEHQLRSAAINERLQAHQQAFTHWRRMMIAVHNSDDEEVRTAIASCQKWWEENCLYLSAESREALSDSFWAAHRLRPKSKAHLTPDALDKAWTAASEAGNVLLKAVELPSLGSRETKDALRSEA